MTGAYSEDVVSSALAVFGLPAAYTREALDSAYRRVALRCHPDKGGRQDLFDTVGQCYRVLTRNAELNGSWRPPPRAGEFKAAVATRASDDRSGFASEAWRTPPSSRMAPNQSSGVGVGPGPGAGAGAGSAFDVAEFNRRYEESRTENRERDAGYSGWMARAATEFTEPDKPLVDPKSGAGAFNNAFERHTPGLDSQSGAIVLRPAEANAGGLVGALFDESEEVEDYTTEVGAGVCGADCRLAHGAQRLASGAWAREEMKLDAGTISRLGAYRQAELPLSADPSSRPGGADRALASDIRMAISGLSGLH